jgi:Ni,Fe-hydrogenase maturation factor
MRTLVIAIGNPLRRDDGVAHHVLIPPGADRRAVLQLTPEMAEEIAGYDSVVFLDADVNAKELRIEPVDSLPSASALTHVARPSEIVAIARALFGFTGRAHICRIPVSDLSEGEGLSPRTESFAQQASRAVAGHRP